MERLLLKSEAHLSATSLSPVSLQTERQEPEETSGEEWLDACEEEEVEEVQAGSGAPCSSSEDGMHSHVSRSENLEQLSISRTLQEDRHQWKT